MEMIRLLGLLFFSFASIAAGPTPGTCLTDVLGTLQEGWTQAPGTDAARAEALSRWDALPGKTLERTLERGEGQEIVRIANGLSDAEGQRYPLAQLIYTLPEPQTLYVKIVRTFEPSERSLPGSTPKSNAGTSAPNPMKRKGLSTYLIAKVLQKHPQITELKADLEWDNYAAFKAAYDAIPRALKRINNGAAIKSALESTPFYKTARRLGFSEIETFHWIETEDRISIVISSD